ncbi:hypothetical protein LUZ63_021697 [Rhynchospora breviuscula]|uniref:Glycosyl hydrolase family 13 catalytic domain-containing protein n=1 Tax=Rhynchospora breviuscula TaxID=2022672 RepID=A0A9P9Z736_9POAL|nr:hypothetical protein LUZ63_021697 [Rhynchospora breviuscula]
MADGGYDVADYRDIDPRYGTLADLDRLVVDAHARGIRIVADIVGNHTSIEHPWFREALDARVGSPARARYHFADGRGVNGELPPNNWVCAFGGPAWTRLADGQWYLHTFAPEQPDLNWSEPTVVDEFADILRFWFDRGIDGVRADAIPAMAKVPGLPDADYDPTLGFRSGEWATAPHWDVDHVHEVAAAWRRVADEYDDRLLIAEAVVRDPQRLALYVRPDEFDTAFNFDFLRAGWDAGRLRETITASLETFRAVGATVSWMLSSHDETRHRTRFGRADTRPASMATDTDVDTDLDLGLRRARAAVLLMYALPGMAWIYQGEELGLPEVADLPDDVLQDPTWARSGFTRRGRDGCRVPLPWGGDRPPYDFGPPSSSPWLPQPSGWSDLTVTAQSGDPSSMLELYRRAAAVRRSRPALAGGEFVWDPESSDVLSFRRGDDVRCLVSFSDRPLKLGGGTVLLASDEIVRGMLPPHAAAWIALD